MHDKIGTAGREKRKIRIPLHARRRYVREKVGHSPFKVYVIVTPGNRLIVYGDRDRALNELKRLVGQYLKINAGSRLRDCSDEFLSVIDDADGRTLMFGIEEHEVL